MSHHNPKLYPEHNTIELRAEMAMHGLDTEKPSMMADAFRFGWVASRAGKDSANLIEQLKEYIELDLSNRLECEKILRELTHDR